MRQTERMSEKVRNCPSEKKTLDPRQQAAVDLIALGRAMTEVARSIAVDRRTLYRWMHHDPLFRAALAHRQRELWSHASSRLQGMVNPALDVLDQHLNGQQYDRVRLRAALSILRLTDLRRRRPDGPEDDDGDDIDCAGDVDAHLCEDEWDASSAPVPEPPARGLSAGSGRSPRIIGSS